MGNINSQIPPHHPGGDKILAKQVRGLASSTETQAATAGASSVQAEAAIKSFLISRFGIDIGNKIFEAIPVKDKIGKDLSFESVRAAIESTTNETIHGKLKDDLTAEMKNIVPVKVPEQSHTDTNDNPFMFIEEARDVMQKAQKETAKLKDAHEERMSEAEAERDVEKKQEIKEEQTKKIYNPKNFPEV